MALRLAPKDDSTSLALGALDFTPSPAFLLFVLQVHHDFTTLASFLPNGVEVARSDSSHATKRSTDKCMELRKGPSLQPWLFRLKYSFQ